MTIILTIFNFESVNCCSTFMMSFKRVQKIKFGKNHINLYIDKNDSVYDVKECEVISWKKKGIPAEVKEERHQFFFNLVKGNPTKIAVNRIIARLELE